MDEAPAWLTAAEVAARLRVSPDTVRRWARDDQIGHVTLPGGQYRFRADVVDAFDAEADDTVRPRIA